MIDNEKPFKPYIEQPNNYLSNNGYIDNDDKKEQLGKKLLEYKLGDEVGSLGDFSGF